MEARSASAAAPGATSVVEEVVAEARGRVVVVEAWPPWMAPLIFVLSLCLGYAYERTGNLWVSIIIHAAFNTTSTVIFLNYV